MGRLGLATKSALVLLAAALLPASAAAQAGEGASSSTQIGGERGAPFAPLEEARAAMSEEERALLELREQMRRLRAERRAAIRSARGSGDPQAMARVQEEFQPRMEALREQVRASREVVMEQRLRENPELAERLGAYGAGGRPQVECGGERAASEVVRRRAFRRLHAMAPEGTLAAPSDIPTPLREELVVHARRVALLQCIRARARAHADTEASIAVRALMRDEQRRHDRVVRELLGAPPAPPGAPARGGAPRPPPPRAGAEPARTEAPR
jgi:hypothetical protein